MPRQSPLFSRQVRMRGSLPVYRMPPINIDKQQYASVHNDNENISVDKLHLAVDFYKSLLRNYK